MTRQALYVKAIDLNPNDFTAYLLLANNLPPNGTVQLMNGTNMTQQALLNSATALNPALPAHVNLGAIVHANVGVQQSSA